MFIIVVLSLMLIFFLNYKFLGDKYSVLNPISISVYIWVLVVVCHNYYFPHESYTDSAYVIILLGNISLAIGFWGTFRNKIVVGKHKDFNKSVEYNISGVKKILKILGLIEIVRIIYNIYVIIYKLAGSWSTFFNNSTYVRRLYLSYNGGAAINVFEFLCNANALIAYVLIGVILARGTKKDKKYFVIWSLLELIYALITMSKMCLIIYAIVVATSCINNLNTIRQQKKMVRKYFPLIAIAILGFLLLIGLQRNYDQKSDSLMNVVLQKAGVYFSGPVEALGKYISLYGSEMTLGLKTFTVFARPFSRLGISTNDAILAHGEDIFIGYESINAYTWYKVFYQDFSYFGIVIIPLIIGAMAGIFYSKKSQDFFNDTCCSWISAVVFMSFYTFLWTQTIYVFILLYVYVIHKKYSYILYKVEGD